MTQRELLKTAYAAAHQASYLTGCLCFPTPDHGKNQYKTDVLLLLEQARVLTAAAQSLQNISAGEPRPKEG